MDKSRSLHNIFTGCAGCAITAGIPVKFGTAHGISRPDVGSTKRTDAYGRKGVAPFSRIFCTADRKTMFLRSKQNFYSLTVCDLDQYLPNGTFLICLFWGANFLAKKEKKKH